ncbi:MAG: translation initiation factor IF-2 [candidate division Zixibacteria bacterium]|nr:translation initiation factor IF-2 [candidate division Zixibacteria bacterium]MBU1469958.1 translation initiation factor IF-2 [candidate division Zixibacteria bacterium]MBU2626071.1 translation initiation factor IF-2 [candidate division Zixibacteria bacterium]
MAKKRLYQVAREFNITSDAIVKMCRDLGFPVKNHMSTADDPMIAAIDKKFKDERDSIKRDIEIKKQKAKSRGKVEISPAPLPEPPSVKDEPVTEAEHWDEVAPKTGLERIKPKDVRASKGGPVDRKKRRKKDKRRQRPRRRPVDQKAVAVSVRKTLATMDGSKRSKKYKRRTKTTGGGEETVNVLQVNEYMSVAELAAEIGIKPTELIAKCISLGMMATINQRLDLDTIEMLALEYGMEVEEIKEIGIDELDDEEEQQDESPTEHRPPVITIMGHVDHGKTSLLDFIRHSNVVAGESGAITQHIGAYQVKLPGGNLTFLDTPGHAAFTAMRARGAQATDLVVLVVAANDAVQQQTVEAIDHARAAGVPIIVAINKMDLPDANSETVKQQLAQLNLLPEDWGGKTITVEISAKTGMNVDKLLEMILLQSEVMELTASPELRATGVVIEARVEKGRGIVCNVLVQNGTMYLGSPSVVGNYYAKIRTMVDDRGVPLTEIGPGTPAQITGLSGIPQAGDRFFVAEDDAQARSIANQRQRIKREQDFRHIKRVALTNIYDQIREGQVSDLNLVIKGDVDGSVEVLSDTLEKLSNEEVRVVIIHRGVGAINENDVLLAAASQAIIIGFHVRPDVRAREIAAREKVDIRQYTVIYEVESDVRNALEGLLAPEESEEIRGTAEIRDLFRIPKQGVVAGCYITSGTILRTDRMRVVRDGVEIYDGMINSLRRFKDDVREVASGFECGIKVENFDDLKVGDILEAYKVIQTARKLQQ